MMSEKDINMNSNFYYWEWSLHIFLYMIVSKAYLTYGSDFKLIKQTFPTYKHYHFIATLWK